MNNADDESRKDVMLRHLINGVKAYVGREFDLRDKASIEMEKKLDKHIYENEVRFQHLEIWNKLIRVIAFSLSVAFLGFVSALIIEMLKK